MFEAIQSARRHRQRCDLYHAALVVGCDGEDYTIEIAPSPDSDEPSRGVVGTGAVGSRHIGWLRLFRLQIRLYHSLPSIAVYSVDGRALVSIFMHGKLADSSPQIELHGEQSLIGRSVFDEVETLWNMAEPVTHATRWREGIQGLQRSTRVVRP